MGAADLREVKAFGCRKKKIVCSALRLRETIIVDQFLPIDEMTPLDDVLEGINTFGSPLSGRVPLKKSKGFVTMS